MKTDKLFYRIFLENPSLISELLPDIPPNCEFEYSAPVIKETEFRLDGILSPTAQDLDFPLIFLEAQMQSDEGFYRRYFAELFLYLQQYPTARPWRDLLIFRSREQKLGSEKAYETLLEQQVQRLYLNDLLSLTNLSSNLGLLKLLVVRKSGVATTAKEILAKARNTQEFRQQLELIEVILANKFPTLTAEEISAMFDLKTATVKEPRLYDYLVNYWQQEGRQEEASAMVCRQLARQCGVLSSVQVEQVKALPVSQLETLGEALLDFSSLSDLDNWLQTN
jgi:predicted transposase YdaD